MRTDELDFELPAELIAQTPTEKRGESRLLHYQRGDRSIAHRRFGELPGLLRRGDLLVFNDARVIPARFTLRKETGGLVDGLFLAEEAEGVWRVMLRNVGMGAVGKKLAFEDDGIGVRILKQVEGGEFVLGVDDRRPAVEILNEVGRMPLPPYIQRSRRNDDRDEEDRRRYQTVYAKTPGAIAAPTAGLHFSEELLAALDEAEVQKAFVTLHVGVGTFKPVAVEELSQHLMHSEAYSIDAEAAEALNRAKSEGRRIIAVGTTAARVLESQLDEPLAARSGETSIFIYPPYRWKHVDALITNFHLPRSTLIALVAAMVGLEEQKRIYQTAIRERYRFFSYGDAMFIE
ncbi:MAG TPA: tRNA preQ1(34) S-adenosylmethionine ribosyltransferase-isomerase QueA [Tepidisphaeraceae bacterium]|jgi:S-adenosylmethionine:tRNA ribosyltransferase-isomerase|nr:tRNA preQ1(34) S-adenosylmethionine ribosyltransferase-isomerase QueA [Tepidisphaeraceae bacterium]